MQSLSGEPTRAVAAQRIFRLNGIRDLYHDPARALAILQIAAILVLGAVTVFRFHIFAEVDERAHLAYVQEVAEHGRIPWVGRDYVSWQELAIEQGTYPRPSRRDPSLLGVRGSSYEGWQPPLYYALAAPAFLIPSDYHDKILAVRAFDLLLLLAAVAILALLARAVFQEHWRVPYCLSLSTILWPGVIVRAITVSNAALELPLVPLYVLVVWNATLRPRPRSLMAASVLLGLCVLTQLTLVCLAVLLLVPLAKYLRERCDRLALGTATLTLALPALLLIGALPAVRHPRLLRTQAGELLVTPLLLGLVTLVGIVLLAAWPAALFPRYLNPMIPLFALFTAWACRQTGMEEKSLLGLAALSSFVLALIWIYMAGAYYFTNVGATLGIHAAPLT